MAQIMETIILLVVVVSSGVVVPSGAWPELSPNCFLAGTWTDPRVTETVFIHPDDCGQPRHNPFRSETVYNVLHTLPSRTDFGKSVLDDPRTLSLLVVRKDNSQQETFLFLACFNEELWAMEVPLGDNPTSNTRFFSLPRKVETPQPITTPSNPNVGDLPTSTTTSTPGQNIMVNLTLQSDADHSD